MIDKWLNAGVLEAGNLHHTTEGTPQGGVISPMLSNIFLHYVLDKWFEDMVRPRMKGKATLVRFADDFVMTFETYHDAKRVMDVLGKRFGRFGLTLHPDKTRFLDFRPQRHGRTPTECKAGTFDFLGFTHVWAKSRKGNDVVRQITAKSRFSRSLTEVKAWCRTNRHRPVLDQHVRLSAVLTGHYAYYGITGNFRRLQAYRQQVVGIWHKWLERRTRGRRLTWVRYRALLDRHPLPAARIVHRYANWNESLA
jgi:RNA-directed DNA polymerase